jgi:glutamate carboxypeptidase
MLALTDFTPYTTQLVELLTRLVEVESPTTDKAAVDNLGQLIHKELVSHGASVRLDVQEKAGDHLVARWNSDSEGEHILFLCHMDTVYDLGTLTQRPVRIEHERLYGPGSLDMKAGIAMLLTAVRVLQEKGAFPQRPITALFTSDEETGSFKSRALIERLAEQADLVLCLEAALADGSLKTARKGTGDLKIVTRGVASHAGADHAGGRNAIEELAHHILAVQRLTDYSTGTTLSTGVVGGGTRANVVPDEAHALVDLRVSNLEEAERIRQWAREVKPVLDGTSVSVTVRQDRPPMPRDALMTVTFEKARLIAEGIGLSLGEGSTGGGSDANFVAALGKPVLDGLGAIGEGGHSEREYVYIPSLPQRTALLAAMLTAW